MREVKEHSGSTREGDNHLDWERFHSNNIFFKSSPEDMFIDFRERGMERQNKNERDINVREKHQSLASYTHLDRESNPQPRYMH